jgi:NAD(P)-dependent dehydrogenase (short-subunit alcohol dehydrogenase family)
LVGVSGRLKDRVALVVGAGSSGPGWGNGKAAAVLFAREGAAVLAADLDPSAAAETVSIISGEGGVAEAFEADVTVTEQVAGLVQACVERFGRIDVLQNNVGVVALGGPVEVSEADWDRVHTTNLKSFYLTSKYVLPIMERQGRGAIVNVSSIASVRWTGISYVAYSTAKAAVNQLTQSVAIEYAARGIRCNAVLPGFMDTPMAREGLGGHAERARRAPIGELGDAWDVAYASLFLASDESKYVTGHCLVVDGGLSCVAG